MRAECGVLHDFMHKQHCTNNEQRKKRRCNASWWLSVREISLCLECKYLRMNTWSGAANAANGGRTTIIRMQFSDRMHGWCACVWCIWAVYLQRTRWRENVQKKMWNNETTTTNLGCDDNSDIKRQTRMHVDNENYKCKCKLYNLETLAGLYWNNTVYVLHVTWI